MAIQKEIDKIAFIQLDEGKILSTRSKGKDKYYIPGGKREAGETDEQTLIREVQEELNVNIRAESISYVGTFSAQAHGHDSGVQVKMTCYRADYDGQLKASNEIAEVKWLNYKDMDLVSYVDIKIFEFLKAAGELK